MTSRSILTLALLAGSAACSASPTPEPTRSTAEAVIKGKNSDTSQDAVVLVIFLDSKTGLVGSCTGTMLAPNLVLTARHCVADTDESAECDSDGSPLAGGVVRGNHKPEQMFVFVGKNRPDFSQRDITPDGTGAQILDDGGKNLCNHDVAMIVLKEPIKNVPIAPVRLDGDVEKGEIITAVGWGVTDKTDQPDVRQQRAGIKVDAVGPDSTAEPPVAPNEFQVGESICSGDSGGPAIATTGAVIGVVSRGGNGQASQNDPSASCVGTNAENLYSKVSAFKDFILGGYELVDADPWYENGPDPRLLKPGTACTDGSECRSNLCLADPSQKNATTCAQDCSASDCPTGLVCQTEGDAKVCRDPKAQNNATSTTTTSGCSTSPASGSTFFSLAVAAFGLAIVRRRKR